SLRPQRSPRLSLMVAAPPRHAYHSLIITHECAPVNIGDKIGPFQVLSTLGSGAHSSILHVRRKADGRQYALKVVPLGSLGDHKFLEQARHEFRVSGMLDHPNILKIYALEEQKNWLFKVTKAHLLIEYVNGKT